MSTRGQEAIAIIGLGCRFPGAPNPAAFWQLLREGRDAIGEVPLERWDIDALYSADPAQPGKTVSRHGGFIENVDRFDWRTLRISPSEAKYLDPQQRLLLEVTWEALEDAGLPFEKIAGTSAGVYIGILWNDYFRLQARNWSQLTSYTVTGNAFAFAAHRISYLFDLHGPSMALDATCASSMVALHSACQSLWLEEIDTALVGGVNLMLSPDSSIIMSKAGLLSPEGRCKTLDASADGFVRGEGAGMVVLKRLSQVTSSDRVYAVIRGVGLNHNGRTPWIMAPSPQAQVALLQETQRKAGIKPEEIGYVELNGTGFLKGDAIEVQALGTALASDGKRTVPCALGSVKTNIGNLEAASGIASLIKVALALYHDAIPPTLNLEQINPALSLEELGLMAQRTLGTWDRSTGKATAAVSVISFSGCNAHVLLQEFPAEREKRVEEEFYLLPLSARSPQALIALATAYKRFFHELEGEHLLRDVCYTASTRRTHHEHRAALIARSKQQFITLLERFEQGEQHSHVIINQHSGTPSSPPVSSDQELSFAVANASGEREELLRTMALSYVRGDTPDFARLFEAEGRCVTLPGYPWQRERLWFDWLDRDFISQAPEQHATPTAEETSLDRPAILAQLVHARPEERFELLGAYIRQRVGDILGVELVSSLKNQQRLFEAGLDSVMAVALCNYLRSDLACPLPATLVFDFPTIDALTRYLLTQVLFPQAESQEPSHVRPTETEDEALRISNVADLSDEEAEALILAKFAALHEENQE